MSPSSQVPNIRLSRVQVSYIVGPWGPFQGASECSVWGSGFQLTGFQFSTSLVPPKLL